jgi:hypothetical protein
MEHTIYSNYTDVRYIIRKAPENNRKWVVEVWYNQMYPNIITGRYKNLKEAEQFIRNYDNTGELVGLGE